MSWVGLILAVLKLANKLFDYANEHRYIAEGEAIAVAKATAEILRKTEYAKHALEEFSAKSDADVDDFLRGLGGDSGDGK